MKKITLLQLLCFIFVGTVLITSCGTDKDAEDFAANNDTFANVSDFTLTGTAEGPGENLGPNAHGGDNTNVKRHIYEKDAPKPDDSEEYPTGALFYKTMTDIAQDTLMAYFGMAKRGNDYDEASNNWEYFTLDAKGMITQRGGSTMAGCNGCHVSAETDFIFSK